jgi:hypothetical protein
MKRAITWIAGIVVGLAIIAFVLFGRSDRQAYRIARGAVDTHVQNSQDRIDMAVEMATKAVDLALTQTAQLPAQAAAADAIKQNIEDIGNILKDAKSLQGEAAITKLDASIEKFDTAMQLLDDAANKAESPAVKSALDRIYGILETTKEQLVQTILNTQN